MILPLEEREEVLIVNSNKETMIGLRHEIFKNFPRTWIFVHHDSSSELYGIEVATTWGTRLPKDHEDNIKMFIEKYMIDRLNWKKDEYYI